MCCKRSKAGNVWNGINLTQIEFSEIKFYPEIAELTKYILEDLGLGLTVLKAQAQSSV